MDNLPKKIFEQSKTADYFCDAYDRALTPASECSDCSFHSLNDDLQDNLNINNTDDSITNDGNDTLTGSTYYLDNNKSIDINLECETPSEVVNDNRDYYNQSQPDDITIDCVSSHEKCVDEPVPSQSGLDNSNNSSTSSDSEGKDTIFENVNESVNSQDNKETVFKTSHKTNYDSNEEVLFQLPNESTNDSKPIDSDSTKEMSGEDNVAGEGENNVAGEGEDNVAGEGDDNVTGEEEDDEYFIDEEYLKDIELNLTKEDEDRRQKEALSDKERGNGLFKANDFKDAAAAYTAGLRLCPLVFSKARAILYSNRAAARSSLDQKKAAINDCNKAIELNDVYTRAILRRAKLEEETELLDEALKDYQRVIELDSGNAEAHAAIIKLPDMITARNEKMKEEMMGKLKDLGNMFLRPFGLSTSNFQLNQDPTSGGYNINFNQNPNSS